MTDHRLASK
jgi:hypothetical protein